MGLRRRYTEFPERAYMERLGNQEIDIDFDNLDLTDILDEAMAVINREEETDGDENAIQEALMYAADEDQIQDDDDDDDDENEQEDEEEDEETQTNRVQEIFGYAPRQYGNDEDVELP
jgi:TATA-binding protein-associated factor Taf7